MKKYETPDFDVTIYEINGDITLNISNSDPDGNEDDWLGWYSFIKVKTNWTVLFGAVKKQPKKSEIHWEEWVSDIFVRRVLEISKKRRKSKSFEYNNKANGKNH